MLSAAALTDALHAWREHAPAAGPHLDGATLYRLTAAGAVAAADAEILAHLSLCPACLGEWTQWRRARSAAEAAAAGEDDLRLAGGFLLAAASPGWTEGLSLPSQCGSYRLEILPQDGGERALAVFEVQAAGLSLEGAEVALRDARGRLLLRGRLRDGRLARPIEGLAGFDLSTWTVSIGRTAE